MITKKKIINIKNKSPTRVGVRDNSDNNKKYIKV